VGSVGKIWNQEAEGGNNYNTNFNMTRDGSELDDDRFSTSKYVPTLEHPPRTDLGGARRPLQTGGDIFSGEQHLERKQGFSKWSHIIKKGKKSPRPGKLLVYRSEEKGGKPLEERRRRFDPRESRIDISLKDCAEKRLAQLKKKQHGRGRNRAGIQVGSSSKGRVGREGRGEHVWCRRYNEGSNESLGVELE